MKKELLTLSAMIDQCVADQYKYAEDSRELYDIAEMVVEHNDFLKQPLTLSQFIPCKDGKPLEEPRLWEHWVERWAITDMMQKDMDEIKAYQTALDAVIFEGWEMSKEKPWIECDKWRIRFSTDRIFLDRNVGDNQFVGTVINEPLISDLAQFTTENPIKLKTK